MFNARRLHADWMKKLRVTREDSWFLGSIGLVILHALDDSFFQPSQGVPASDHLVSGTVQTLFLFAAAFLFMRSLPGRRALIAAFVGVGGLVGGVELVVAVGQGTSAVSGDDYTAGLSVLGGTALLVMSASIGWRGRNRSGSIWSRVTRRSLVAVVLSLSAFLVAFPLSLAYVTTHTVGTGIVAAPDLGAPVDQVSFHTADGIRLTGWYVRSSNGAAVIVVPGRSGLSRARMLARHGYGVLLLNRRGEGNSGGDPNSLGWSGHQDVDAAAAFLRSQPDVAPGSVGALGLSVGGEVALEAAARTASLDAVVSEGAGARSLRETMETSASIRSQLLVLGVLSTAAVMVLADEQQPPNLVSLVRQIATPVLVIWAELGVEPELELGRKYAAAVPNAESWEVPGSTHIGGLAAQPAAYEQRVVAFFDHALVGR